jgi:rapamycin-insensitive companion of mTOR
LELLRIETLTFAFRTLVRDNKHAAEKEQAIKLIRAVIEVGTVHTDTSSVPGAGVVPLSEAIIRAVIAVAEQPDDPFRPVCILTLTELCRFSRIIYLFRDGSLSSVLIDINLLAKSGGITFLLHALGEGSIGLAYVLASTFLHIIDYPRTRTYLQLGSDLEVLQTSLSMKKHSNTF